MNKYWIKWSYIYESYTGNNSYQDEQSLFVETEDLESWWTGFCSDNNDLKKIKLIDVVKL